MATTQSFSWPMSASVTVTGIGDPTGAPVPADAVYVGGEDPNGNLHGLQTDLNGALIVSPLTTSSTVKADLQDGAGNPITSQVNGGQRALDVGIDVAGVQVDPRQIRALTSADTVTAVQPTGSNLHVQVDASALPSGAATSTNQTSGAQKTQIVDGSGNVISSTTNWLNVDVMASALPSGAATSANQNTANSTLSNIETETTQTANNTAGLQVLPGTNTASTAGATVLGAVTTNPPTYSTGEVFYLSLNTSGGLRVDGSNSTQPTTVKGTPSANAPIYNDYTMTNITTSAYTQLVASTSNTINTIHIFDSSGQAMIFATGAPGVETNQLYVPPGGDTYTLTVPAGTRIAYKALTANATSGFLLMSFLE